MNVTNNFVILNCQLYHPFNHNNKVFKDRFLSFFMSVKDSPLVTNLIWLQKI